MPDADAKSIASDLDATSALAAKDAEITALSKRGDELLARAEEAEGLLKEVNGWLGHKDQQLKTLTDANESLTAELATRPAAVAPKAPSIRLTAPHGFVEDATGIQRTWQAGQVVTDPAEMALLRERQAPIEDVV